MFTKSKHQEDAKPLMYEKFIQNSVDLQENESSMKNSMEFLMSKWCSNLISLKAQSNLSIILSNSSSLWIRD